MCELARHTIVLYRMSPDWREMRQLNSATFLAETAESTPNWFETYIPPDAQAYVRAAIDEAVRNGSHVPILFEL